MAFNSISCMSVSSVRFTFEKMNATRINSVAFSCPLFKKVKGNMVSVLAGKEKLGFLGGNGKMRTKYVILALLAD